MNCEELLFWAILAVALLSLITSIWLMAGVHKGLEEKYEQIDKRTNRTTQES